MLFEDRYDAGSQLVDPLSDYKDNKNAVILGLPRGGVVTAAVIAQKLGLPLDIICPRKIGAPFNPEFAIGAITETGQYIINPDVENYNISQKYLDAEISKEKLQAQRRLSLYRKNRPPRNVKGKIVILVDDGLATGSTMKAAILSVKAEGAAKIIVAVPVSPVETLQEIKALVDEVVCLYTPSLFQAIGQFYGEFYPVEDEEVISLLNLKEVSP